MRIVRAGRYLFSLGLRMDRARLLRAVVLMFAGYIAAPLAALALRSLTDSLLGRQAGPALTYALLAAVLLVAQLMLSHFALLDYFEVAELQQSQLRGELMALVNGPPGIDHLDRADFADNTGLVRDGLFGSTRALEAVLQLAGLFLQTAITAGILIDLNPFFAFLPLCAVVPVLLERPAQAAVESAREQTAERLRLNKHLIELATSTGSVRELRLFGGEGELLARQRSTWDEVTAAMWRSQLKAAAYRAAGQGFFALGYGGAILLELAGALHGHASIGDLVLVITLAVQVSVQVSGALGLLSLLATAGRTVDRMRPSPLLLVLDEPAAARDASAEHELFERYASSAGRAGQGQGGVTVLVSHRFSTVLMADRIAVLEQGRLAEFGAHRDLMTAGGLYAELFALQARAYG